MVKCRKMPSRSPTFVRLLRALLACLIVLVAFEPPAPRVELDRPVAAATADSRAKAPLVRRAEAPRSERALPPAIEDAPLVARYAAATPRERVRVVSRLYVELCSLLC